MSFLSVVHPLGIPILMYEKKIWVQQENSYTITLIVYMYFQPLILAIHTQSMNSRNLSKTAEKSSSSPRAAGVLVRAEMPSTWRADLPTYSRQIIYLTKIGGQICHTHFQQSVIMYNVCLGICRKRVIHNKCLVPIIALGLLAAFKRSG